MYIPDKPIGKKPLGRPRRRWEDNIRMDFKEKQVYKNKTKQEKNYQKYLIHRLS